MIAWLLCAGLGWAQGVTPPPVPAVRGDAFLPSPFADGTWGVDDSSLSLRASMRVVAGYARDPLVAQELAKEGSRFAFVQDLGFMVATGGVAIHRFRLGLTLPFYAVSGSTGPASDQVLVRVGDPTVDLHVVALERAKGRPGVTVTGRVAGPLGAHRIGLGADGVTWEAAVALDGQAGPVWIGGTVGWRGVPEVRLEQFVWTDGLLARLGLSANVHPRWLVSGEIHAFIGLLDKVTPEGAPAEGMVSAAYRTPSGLEARLGIGIPVTPGAGVPLVRALLGLSWRGLRPHDARW